MSKRKILLTVLLPAHAIVSMHSLVLNFTTPRSTACHGHSQHTVHQNPWKGVQRRRQLSRVNGTIKMQQAPNIQINAKSDPFPNLLFFLQNCGHRKAATDPRTQVQQLPSNKKWFHFSPRVCDFQPPCRSHAHVVKKTTCIVPRSLAKPSIRRQSSNGVSRRVLKFSSCTDQSGAEIKTTASTSR